MATMKQKWDANVKKDALSSLKGIEQKIRSGEMKIETHALYRDNGTGKLHLRMVLVEKEEDSDN